MASKPKTKQEEALQFLDDLENLSPDTVPVEPVSSQSHLNTSIGKPAQEADATEVMKFLDDITQKSSEPTRIHVERPLSRAGTPGPGMRKSTERVRLGGNPPSSSASTGSLSSTGSTPNVRSSAAPQLQTPPASAAGGWGWGNVWSTASAAIQQAKSVVDEQVKNLPNNEQARKWTEGVKGYVNTEQLEKLAQEARNVGFSTLTEILNAVAPPISEHEVIQVCLSHDMEGYEGVESLVYKALTRIMDQVEGGDLVVNKHNENRPKDKTSGEKNRDMNAVDGLEAALKLSEASLKELARLQDAKKESTPQTSTTNPTSYSYVYLRIQPFFTTVQTLNPSSATTEPTHFQFLLHLSDPGHDLVHRTTTQAISKKWLACWDQHDWIEDMVVEVLRVGVEMIGQDYLSARMRWLEEPVTAPVVKVEGVEVDADDLKQDEKAE